MQERCSFVLIVRPSRAPSHEQHWIVLKQSDSVRGRNAELEPNCLRKNEHAQFIVWWWNARWDNKIVFRCLCTFLSHVTTRGGSEIVGQSIGRCVFLLALYTSTTQKSVGSWRIDRLTYVVLLLYCILPCRLTQSNSRDVFFFSPNGNRTGTTG